MGSARQMQGQYMVRIRIACVLGDSPSGLIHSVALRYSQTWLRALHSGARD